MAVNINDDPLVLLMLVLATWRISYMLTLESGPFGVFERLRKLPNGGLLTCIFCLSVWMAALMLVLYPVVPVVIYALAISAGALLVDKVVSG